MVMGHELTHGFDDRGNSFISWKMLIILGRSFVLVRTPSRESLGYVPTENQEAPGSPLNTERTLELTY